MANHMRYQPILFQCRLQNPKPFRSGTSKDSIYSVMPPKKNACKVDLMSDYRRPRRHIGCRKKKHKTIKTAGVVNVDK